MIRTNYAAQLNGKEGGSNIAVRNIFVKPDFVQADGKDFGTMVMDRLPAYGDEWSGVNLADSQDGLYNPEKLRLNLLKLRKPFKQKEFSSQFIWMSLLINQSKITVNQVQSIKQSVGILLLEKTMLMHFDIHAIVG